MNCQAFENLLSQIEDIKLLKKGMEEHAKICPACSELLNEQREVASLLADTKIPKLSTKDWDSLETELFAAIDKIDKPVVQILPFWSRPIFRTSVAMAALLLLTVTLLFQWGRSRKVLVSGERVTVAFIQGTASVKEKGASGFNAYRVATDFPSRPMPIVKQGSVVETQAASSIGLRMEKLAEVSVHERSRLELVRAEKGAGELVLDTGALTVHVNPEERTGRFTVVTPNAQCLITGTLFQVSYKESLGVPVTHLSVTKGKVRFTVAHEKAETLSIGMGEQAEVRGTSLSPLQERAPDDSPILLKRFETGFGEAVDEGYLHVVTVPAACSLFSDDKFLGLSPLVIAVPPGSVKVRAHCNGYATTIEKVVVQNTKSTPLFIPLQKSKVPVNDSGAVAIDTVFVVPTTDEPESVVVEAPVVDSLALRYQKAKTLIANGRFNEAVILLGRCADKDPVCRMWLARCREELHQFDEALSSFTILASDANAPQEMRDNAQYSLINIHLNGRKDAHRALESVEQYCSLYPTGNWREEALFEKGRVLQMLNRNQDAVEAFEYYAKKYPKGVRTATALNEAAMIRLNRLSDAAGALQDFEEFLALNGKALPEETLFWRSQALFVLGKSVDAGSGFKEYLKKYPSGRFAATCKERMKNLYTGK